MDYIITGIPHDVFEQSLAQATQNEQTESQRLVRIFELLSDASKAQVFDLAEELRELEILRTQGEN